MEKALWAGFVLGAGVAAGIGPISLLCVASGVRHGFRPAVGVGLGAATVDGLYALAAALGAAALIAGRTATVIQVAGGIAMVAIAFRLARGGGAAGAAPSRFGRAYQVSFAATLANPATIVSWVGAFAAAVPALHLTKMETATALPAGVVIGSAAWFIGLATASALAGKRMNDHALRVLSYIGACAIGGFGVAAVLTGVGVV